MSDTRCIEVRSDGTQCPHPAEGNAVYCDFHLVLNSLPDEQKVVIADFIEDNWKPITAYLAGAFGEAAIGDLYNTLKTLAGNQAPEQEILETLQSVQDQNASNRIRKAKWHYKRNKDYESLAVLVNCLTLGMWANEVEDLLGIKLSEEFHSTIITSLEIPPNLIASLDAKKRSRTTETEYQLTLYFQDAKFHEDWGPLGNLTTWCKPGLSKYTFEQFK